MLEGMILDFKRRECLFVCQGLLFGQAQLRTFIEGDVRCSDVRKHSNPRAQVNNVKIGASDTNRIEVDWTPSRPGTGPEPRKPCLQNLHLCRS